MGAGRKNNLPASGRMRATRTDENHVNFHYEQTEMAARLERIADVRASAVARGKSLVANPNYPDQKTLRGVARVLARHLAK
jgi:hypothetical protein